MYSVVKHSSAKTKDLDTDSYLCPPPPPTNNYPPLNHNTNFPKLVSPKTKAGKILCSVKAGAVLGELQYCLPANPA